MRIHRGKSLRIVRSTFTFALPQISTAERSLFSLIPRKVVKTDIDQQPKYVSLLKSSFEIILFSEAKLRVVELLYQIIALPQ